VVRFLSEHNAGVNSWDWGGRHSIKLSAEGGDSRKDQPLADVARLLLHHGAVVSA